MQLEDLELRYLNKEWNVAHLAKLSHLRKLKISCLRRFEKLELPLAQMTALRELTLVGFHCTNVDLSAAPQLETLSLHMCCVRGLVHQTQLRRLVLRSVVLAAGEWIPDVEELHISLVRPFPLKPFLCLSAVPRLKIRRLSIMFHDLCKDEEIERVLLYLLEVPTLTSIWLHNVRLRPQHVRLVERLPEACTLHIPKSELLPWARELHSATLPIIKFSPE